TCFGFTSTSTPGTSTTTLTIALPGLDVSTSGRAFGSTRGTTLDSSTLATSSVEPTTSTSTVAGFAVAFGRPTTSIFTWVNCRVLSSRTIVTVAFTSSVSKLTIEGG